jgi:entericidin B
MRIVRFAALLAALLAPLTLAACHTVQGAGQDLDTAGHAISKAATDVQKKM